MAIRKIVSRALTDSLNVDSGTLVVDDANNRVGIGTATPSVDLDIQSTGSGTKLNIASTGAGINVDLTDASATSRIRHVGTILDFGADYTNTAVSDPRIRFRVGNTPQCSINAHGGIAFGNDTAAANTLDDYEEGTWTPTINEGSVSINYARYVKVGNLVTLTTDLTDISNNTSTSDVQISGLPFNTHSSGRFTGTMMYRYLTAPSNANQLTPYIGNNSSTIAFYWSFSTNSTWDGLQFSSGNGNWDIYFSLTYITD